MDDKALWKLEASKRAESGKLRRLSRYQLKLVRQILKVTVTLTYGQAFYHVMWVSYRTQVPSIRRAYTLNHSDSHNVSTTKCSRAHSNWSWCKTTMQCRQTPPLLRNECPRYQSYTVQFLYIYLRNFPSTIVKYNRHSSDYINILLFCASMFLQMWQQRAISESFSCCDRGRSFVKGLIMQQMMEMHNRSLLVVV